MRRNRSAEDDERHRLEDGLAGLTEHLAVLLASGLTLDRALRRAADVGDGIFANELRIASTRIATGLGERAAMRECTERQKLPDLDRLVRVLELNRTTADLAPHVAAEARWMREDEHEHLMASLDRRVRLVWAAVGISTVTPVLVDLVLLSHR